MRLTPQNSVFYELFADAGRNVAEAADVLVGLADQDADRRSIATALTEWEHRGDTVTHRILREVNTSFVTPFDREDIYRLASTLDDVLDAMEEVADFVELANVGVLPRLVVDQLRLVQRSAHETATAMGRLRTLKDLEPYWIEVNRLLAITGVPAGAPEVLADAPRLVTVALTVTGPGTTAGVPFFGALPGVVRVDGGGDADD